MKVKQQIYTDTTFPIAIIGASAGGLEAFTDLLKDLPKDTGIAYVFISHLDPSHKSMMVELVSRKTSLPVSEATNNISVSPNHIYIIPPNKYMTIVKGKLKLTPRTSFSGQYMPIDYFMRSAARELKNRGIGVILSGTASDGALGLQEIRESDGITFVQEPQSAQYAGMPRAAIAAGVIDYVLDPAAIAKELTKIGKQPLQKVASIPNGIEQELTGVPKAEKDLSRVFAILRLATGADFTDYKRSTILRRLSRRITLKKSKNLEEYAALLKENREEVINLYQDLLINVTKFFRDPHVFEELKSKVFPALVKNRARGEVIRIWVAGCSGGEETYSIAICLLEFLEEKGLTFPIQLFGSDLSEKEITKARTGLYIENIALDVSAARLKQFFVKENSHYRIQKYIRDMCIFSKHDLVADPPFSNMDLISCRNVLIYMEQVLQNKIVPLFHFSLKPQGFLVLGLSETMGRFGTLFSALDNKHRIYAKKATTHRMQLSLVNRSFEAVSRKVGKSISTTTEISSAQSFDIQKEADRLLLAGFTPASVLVNSNMEILQFRGHTGLFLEPASGTASLNLLKMAKEGLVLPLRSAIAKAAKLGIPVTSTDLEIKQNSESMPVELEIIPVKAPVETDQYFLILFKTPLSKVDTFPSVLPRNDSKSTLANRQLTQVRQELQATKDYLQSALEEQEATNEELKASNEEILSSNEELQSTNEELETSKEELQSTNEELTTLNQELQTRYVELEDAIEYGESIVKTVREPILILTGNLQIRSANPSFYKTFKVTPAETEGKRLYELGGGQWDNPELRKQLEEILPQDNELKDFEIDYRFPLIGQKSMVLNARRLVQKSNKEALILLAIEDTTQRNKAEEILKQSEEKYRSLFETMDQGFCIVEMIFDKENKPLDYRFLEINKVFEKQTGIKNAVGRRMKDIAPKHEEHWFEIYGKVAMTGKAIRFQNPATQLHRFYDVYAFRVGKPVDRKVAILFTDITERKKEQEALKESLEHRDEFIGIASHELKTPVTSVKAYTQILQSRFRKTEDMKSVELIGKMDAQLDKLTSLIGDLLDTTKIEAGRLQFHESYFDFNEFVTEIVEELQRTTEKHKIVTELAASRTVYGDRDRLGQVLTNFVTNAIKYSPHTEKIIVKTAVDKDSVRLCVQDFGVGLSIKDQAKVFERFYRVGGSSQDTYPGLGLGLYISSEIIKRQNGKIWVESKRGKGSLFYFSLPIKKEKIKQQKNTLAEEEMKRG